jgi:hypothetical protein
MLGVPGAGYLGAAIDSGFDIAAVSPNGKAALGIADGSLVLVRWDSGAAVRTALGRRSAQAEKIVWNAASDAAAVVAGAHVELWGNVFDAPRMVEFNAPGPVLALAVSDGVSLAFATGGDETGGVYAWSGEARLLARTANASAIALTRGGDLFFADRAANEVLEIKDWLHAAGPAIFASAAEGVADPVALALSGDETTVFIAGGQSRSLLARHRSTGVLTAIALEFEPSRLEAFGNALYWLNARSATDALQLLAGGATPAVYFVPGED